MGATGCGGTGTCCDGASCSNNTCVKACSAPGEQESAYNYGCCNGGLPDSNGVCVKACATMGEPESSYSYGCCDGAAPDSIGICVKACSAIGETASSSSYGCCSGGAADSGGICRRACAQIDEVALSQPGGCCSGGIPGVGGICKQSCASIGQAASSQPGGCCAGGTPDGGGICKLACAQSGQLASSQPAGCCAGLTFDQSGICQAPVSCPKDASGTCTDKNCLTGCTAPVAPTVGCTAGRADNLPGPVGPGKLARITANATAGGMNAPLSLSGAATCSGNGSCSVEFVPPAAGLYEFRATAVSPYDDQLGTEATCTLDVKGSIIEITPAILTVTAGDPPVTFTAVAKDVDGNVLAQQPTFTWTANQCGALSGTTGATVDFQPGIKNCSHALTVASPETSAVAGIMVVEPVISIMSPYIDIVYQRSSDRSAVPGIVSSSRKVEEIKMIVEVVESKQGSGDQLSCPQTTSCDRPFFLQTGKYRFASQLKNGLFQVTSPFRNFYVYGPPVVTKMSVSAPDPQGKYKVGVPITITAEASDNPDNKTVSTGGGGTINPGLQWVRIENGSGNRIPTNGRNNVSVQEVFTPMAAGRHTFSATALSTLGMYNPETKYVSVDVVGINQGPTVTLSQPKHLVRVPVGSDIFIEAQASAVLGKFIQKLELWETHLSAMTQKDTKLFTMIGSPARYTWKNVPAGTYSFYAAATDNEKMTSTSTYVTLFVESPPTVTWVTPADNSTHAAGSDLPLTVHASDPDSLLLHSEFWINGSLMAVIPAPSTRTADVTYTWQNIPPGTQQIQVVVMDDNFQTTRSDTLTLNVTGSLPPPPPPPGNVRVAPPQIASMLPMQAQAGGISFLLNVIGNQFTPTSRVLWNGQPRGTTFVDAMNLQAAIPASDIVLGGVIPVVVEDVATTAASTPFNFTVNLQRPGLHSVTPFQATAGQSLDLAVMGTGFAKQSVIQWNGTSVTTVMAAPDRLTATIPSSLITREGQALVTVFNPAPGGGQSPGWPVTVYPAPPEVEELSRGAAAVGEQNVQSSILGSHFQPVSTVWWNSRALTTEYVSERELRFTVPSDAIVTPTSADLYVNNNTGFSSQSLKFLAQSLGTLDVSPREISVPLGASQQFRFEVRDDQGQPYSADIPLTITGEIAGVEARSLGVISAAKAMAASSVKAAAQGGANTLTLATASLGLAPGDYILNLTATDPVGRKSTTRAKLSLFNATLSNLRLYPNPWRADRDSDIGITIDGLSSGTSIRIFDVAGRHVKTLQATGLSVSWDLKNDSGDLVTSGIYLFVAEDAGGDRRRGKFAVIR